MKRLPLIALAALLPVAGLSASAGAAVINFIGGTYSENFDGMAPGTAATSAWGLSGTSATIGVQFAITGATGFQGAKIAGTGTGAMPSTIDNGSNNGGAIFDYGAFSDTERALGALASGTNIAAFGAEISNGSGVTLTQITISFITEQWRSSTSTQNILAFAYGSGGTATSSNFLTDTSMIAFASLNAVAMPPVTTNAATNGNDPSNQTAVTATIGGLSLAPGSSLFIRWSDTNDIGNDAGVAIDNLNITSADAPTAAPEPASLALAGLGGLALLGRRRRS